MTAKVELRLRGTLDHLRVAWQTGETLIESIPFAEDPEGTRYNILLAVQEMVTNVLRHGYGSSQSGPGADDTPLEIDFEADAGGVTITVRDRGPAFDPTTVDSDPIASDDFPQIEGGYGIMIAKMVMDSLDYERDGEWNVLRMTKLAASPAKQTAS